MIERFEEDGDKQSILLIDTYTSKAFALSHLERYKEAHELCEKAKEINPNEGLIYLTEGKLYLAEELEDEAAISFEKAIEINPNIEMWYMIASAYSESDYLIEAKEYFEKVYQINPKYEDVTEKLSVLCLMHGEIDNFFKYNKECEHPLEEDMILDLLNSPEHREEDERTLKEVWERMKKENKKKQKEKINQFINSILKNMESVAELLKWVLENLNYWVVTIFMAIESSFIPFPSEAVVPPAAWKAMADDSMNIFLVVLFATIGADIGALVNYYLARWLGRPIIYKFANSRLGHMCLIDEEKIHHAEEYFRKHGAASTFFGRLIPAVRQLISIPAGLAGMKIGPFLLYTTLGAAIWNSILALLGYLIYRFTDLKTTNDVYVMATEYSHEIGYVIIAVVVIVIVFLAYKGLKKENK